jgi:hypothetical protein
MEAKEAAEVYSEAAEALAECDQELEDEGSCEAQRSAYSDAYNELTAAHANVEAYCGGGPPIGNRTPVAGSVVVPAVTALQGSTLECDASGFFNDTATTEIYTYRWYVSGTPLPGLQTSQYSLIYGNLGNELKCSVQASDGELLSEEVFSNDVRVAEAPAPQIHQVGIHEGPDYILLEIIGTNFIPNVADDGELFGSKMFEVRFTGAECNIREYPPFVTADNMNYIGHFEVHKDAPTGACFLTINRRGNSDQTETYAGLVVSTGY